MPEIISHFVFDACEDKLPYKDFANRLRCGAETFSKEAKGPFQVSIVAGRLMLWGEKREPAPPKQPKMNWNID